MGEKKVKANSCTAGGAAAGPEVGSGGRQASESLAPSERKRQQCRRTARSNHWRWLLRRGVAVARVRLRGRRCARSFPRGRSAALMPGRAARPASRSSASSQPGIGTPASPVASAPIARAAERPWVCAGVEA